MQEFDFIPWVDVSHFQLKTTLGVTGTLYSVQGDYNIRGEHWSLTLTTEDGVVLIQNRKLTLGVDLLDNCHVTNKPACALVPWTEDENIVSITYENMISGAVKLFHIPLTP
jgi:hypothetical protein